LILNSVYNKVIDTFTGGNDMTQEHLSFVQKYLEEKYRTTVFDNFFDFKIVELKEGKAVYNVKIDKKHTNIYGFVHGGVFDTICDVVMGVSCITLGKLIVTLDMNLSYIKNVPSGNLLTAVGEVISSGNTIMRASSEVYCDQQLLVKAQATYFITGEFSSNLDQI